jgi:hypothetical protein
MSAEYSASIWNQCFRAGVEAAARQRKFSTMYQGRAKDAKECCTRGTVLAERKSHSWK